MFSHTKIKWLICFAYILTLSFGIFWFADYTFAQAQAPDKFGLEGINSTIGLTNVDIRIVIGRIIRVILGFLGIVAIGLIIYGGFVYMTAGGDESKVEQAKKILINSIIGLVIILASFAITQFVLGKLQSALDGAGIVSDDNIEGDCFDENSEFYRRFHNTAVCRDGIDPDLICQSRFFVVGSITPSMPNVVNRNVDMFNITSRALFSRSIKAGFEGSQVFTIKRNNVDVSNEFNFSWENGSDRRIMEAVYSGINRCINQNGENIPCLPEGEYKINVSEDLRDSNNKKLVVDTDCGSYPTQAIFNTGSNSIENLINDGDMEIENAGQWGNYGVVNEINYFRKTIDDKFAGIRSMQFHGTIGVQQVNLPVVAEKSYRLSFRYKITNPNAVINMALGINDSNSDFRGNVLSLPQNGNDWREYSVIFNTPREFLRNGVNLVNPDKTIRDFRLRISLNVPRNLRDRIGELAPQLEAFVDNVEIRPVVEGGVDSFIDQTNPEFNPNLTINRQNGGNIRLIAGRTYNIEATLRDNKGNSYTNLLIYRGQDDNGALTNKYFLGPRVNLGSKPNFPLRIPYRVQPLQANVSETYLVVLRGYDIDGNEIERRLNFAVIGRGCDNGVQDGNEIGVDQGGWCGSGDGEPCSSDLDCSDASRCIEGICQPRPRIDDLSPLNGRPGTLVSIAGKNFGQQRGRVVFRYSIGANSQSSDANMEVCGNENWSNEEVIIGVPEGIPQGTDASIELITSDDFSDSSADDFGPRPGPEGTGLFRINDQNRPCLCPVTVEAEPGVTRALPGVDLIAPGFNFTNDRGSIYFGQTPAPIRDWSDTLIRTQVPNLNLSAGVFPVYVRTINNIDSNIVRFTVLSNENGLQIPIISNIDPASTTLGTYVTITGKGFGENKDIIYIAKTPDNVKDCFDANPDNRPSSCRQLKVNLPASCGDNWQSKQIIFELTDNSGEEISVGEYHLILRNSNGRKTDGEALLNVGFGDTRPGICAIIPNTGPAPTPANGAPLQIIGHGFNEHNAQISFWHRRADPSNLNSWLQSNDLTNIPNGVSVRIPFNANLGYSMDTGPIKVTVNGESSNGIAYTVFDCREQAPMAGYQCCLEGPEQGRWKPEEFICEGQTRTAGYVWRFTTGFIPVLPRVVERCEQNFASIPSPTPWENHLDGKNACVNSDISVSFNVLMDPDTFPNRIRVYSCEDQVVPDKAEDCVAWRILPNNELDILDFGDHSLMIRRVDGEADILDSNTWYHVELLNGITSLRSFSGPLGETEVTEPLSATRPCNNFIAGNQDTVYCFNFKTGDNTCVLESAGIEPSRWTTKMLGKIQDNRYPMDLQNLFNPAYPKYFYVWGGGDHSCETLNVDIYPWQWGGADISIASSELAPNEKFVNSRGTVIAKRDYPQGVEVIAEVNDYPIIGNIQATSTIHIDLEDPMAIEVWPLCTEACINAEIGLKFNRMMDTGTYDGNVRIFKCADELCTQTLSTSTLTIGTNSDQFTLRSYLLDANWVSIPLDPNTWYLVEATGGQNGIRSVIAVDDDGNFQVGEGIQTKRWKFRTRDSNIPCLVDKVAIKPSVFIARQVGQKTMYSATPLGSPDVCNPSGQNLNPWDYGWNWSAEDQNVATTSHFAYSGSTKPYCSNNCLFSGSDIKKDEIQANLSLPAVCGDGVVGPGEDCDILGPNEVLGRSCTINCLRPGNTQIGNEANSCGNGVIDSFYGEECDLPGEFCNANCTWKGTSTNQPNGGVDRPWCGSGDVTIGEDCDINISLPEEGRQVNRIKYGCSENCLHTGTKLSQSWCDNNPNANFGSDELNRLVASSCERATSVCGNGLLESGEECEVLLNNLEMEYFGFDEGREVHTIGGANLNNFCDNQCLIKNACELRNVEIDNGELICSRDNEGCKNDCTLGGSSVLYNESSLCGDGVVGPGEYFECESGENDIPLINILGENPVQMITAVGFGIGGEFSRGVQETLIQARASAIRDANRQREDLANQISGTGNYRLQCGYTEFPDAEEMAGGGGNMILDGNMENLGIIQNIWEYDTETTRIEKSNEVTDEVGVGGERSLHLSKIAGQGNGNALYKRLNIQRGRVYNLSFDYYAQRESRQNHSVQILNSGDIVNNFNLVEDDGWNEFGGSFTVNQIVEDFGINFSFTDIYIDNLELRPMPAGEGDASYNNCPGDENDPGNANNTFGVANNTCCYNRSKRVLEYPIDGSVGACLNTFLAVSLRGQIEERTLENNVLLAKTYEDGEDCNFDDDVTNFILADASKVLESNQSLPWGLKIWQKIKNLFKGIFGNNVFAARNVDPNKKWCVFEKNLDKKINYESVDGVVTTTTVGIYLDDLLEINKEYAVILKGGENGIKDINGVGIKSHDSDSRHDSWLFTTGDDICRLGSIIVDPTAYTFTAPNTTSSFFARAIGENPNELIVSIPGVYEWEWSWHPTNNNVFNIPMPNTATNTDRALIGSKELEGAIKGVVQAEITHDSSGQENNKVVSALFDLEAFFCESPWPVDLANFPYEENRFNFRMSYCADAGVQGTKADDLPLLEEQQILGDFSGGFCAYSFEYEGGNFSDLIEFNGRNIYSCNSSADCRPGAENFVGIESTMENILEELKVYEYNIYDNANSLYFCKKVDNNDVLKKTLFFNEKNKDAIGIQIFSNNIGPNGSAVSLSDWYKAKDFENISNMKPVTVGGFQGLSDGNNYYINAFNLYSENPEGEVSTPRLYQNVYLFSINPDAGPQTKAVFDKLLKSLEFNINITDYGYCLRSDSTNLRIEDQESMYVDSLPCVSDFDCHNDDGTLKEGTSGICSNVKTKISRDLKRLSDVKNLQTALEKNSGNYPTMQNNSFIANLTLSRWPESWRKLNEEIKIGILPRDPLNDWTDCPNHDPQTCWNSSSSTFSCPLLKSVYEYEYIPESQDYLLHIPFEYFDLDLDENIVNSFILNKEKVTSIPFCRGNILTLQNGVCGDGFVNLLEKCDPPESYYLGNMCVDIDNKGIKRFGRTKMICSDDCKIHSGECEIGQVCGNGKVEGSEKCDDGEKNNTYGHCNDTCSGLFQKYCGNNIRDFNNQTPLEYCDTSEEPASPLVFFKTDLFFSFNSDCSENIRTRTNFNIREERCLGLDGVFHNCTEDQIKLANSFNVVLNDAQSEREDICDNYIGYCSGKNNYVCRNSDDCKISFVPYLENIPSINPENALEISKSVMTTTIFDAGTCTPYIRNYQADKNYSCAEDCQDVGGYCGDQILQRDNETCEDGNRVLGDGCDSYCKTEEEAPVEPVAPNPEQGITSCGDGNVQKPNSDGVNEACDLGSKNGIACKPPYSREGVGSCTYCSEDCRNVLTVESSARCGDGVVNFDDLDGDGKLDERGEENKREEIFETCDTLNGVVMEGRAVCLSKNVLQSHIIATTTRRILEAIQNNPNRCPNGWDFNQEPLVCSDKGNYVCNGCQLVVNNCVNCGLRQDAGGVTPYIAMLNPMIIDARGGQAYPNDYFVTANLFRYNRSSSTYTYLGWSNRGHSNLQGVVLEPLEALGEISNNTPHKKIESNLLCSDDYLVTFNNTAVGNLRGPDENNIIRNNFSYTVNNEVGRVEHEYIVSPAVPEGVFRVVVRWTKAEASSEFTGVVYSEAFENTKIINSINPLNPLPCRIMMKDVENYWWPGCVPLAMSRNVVYRHEKNQTITANNIIRSFTIDTATSNFDSRYGKPIAFMVQSLRDTIALHTMDNLTVEVYAYHEGQIPENSVYNPVAVFSINGANPSNNPAAVYWHVFNLEKNAQTSKYEIKKVRRLCNDSGQCEVYDNGSIETNICRVYNNIPGHPIDPSCNI